MKRLIAWLFFLLPASYIDAQDALMDSLQTELSLSAEDTNRVKLLYEIGDHQILTHPDSAFSYALQGVALSRKLGYRKGEMLGLAASGKLLLMAGNYPEALHAQLQALQLAEKDKAVAWISEICMNIASIYFYQKDHEHALKYMHQVKDAGETLNDKTYLQIAMENIGAVYIIAKQYDSALVYTQQAYSLGVELKLPVYNILLNLGHIYSAKNQLGLALEYFRTALPDIIAEDNSFYKSEAYLGMAEVFLKQEQQDSAIYYGKKSLATANAIGFVQGRLDAAAFIADIYKKQKNSDSAFFYSEEAKVANDSLFSQQKINQLQSLTLMEQLRQREKEEKEREAKEERKHNLQYAGIAIGLIVFILIFLLLSHSIIVNKSLIRFLGALSLLILFEFINLLIHPFIAGITHHSPVGILAVMVCVAAMLIPLHHKLEHWMINRLVEKNKKIRIIAARKTLQELENRE